MHRILFLTLVAIICFLAPVYSAPNTGKKPIVAADEPAAKTPRLIEFDGDQIQVALRTLARSAKINLVTDDEINDTVTIRLEDKTPMEAIRIIVQSKDLVMEEHSGIYFVRPKIPAPPGSKKDKELSQLKEFTETFAPALAGFYDSLLDFQARPETARKIARAKKALYEAFIAEGFTKEEAFRLILTTQELPAFENKR